MTTTNSTTSALKAVVLVALVAAGDDARWRNAIKRAVRELQVGNTPRCLPNGHAVIGSRTNGARAYEVNGRCQCQAAQNGTPCWHRAAKRIFERYTELEGLRSRYTWQGRSLQVNVTPGGELVLEDEVTGRCFAVEAIQSSDEPGDLDLAPATALAA